MHKRAILMTIILFALIVVGMFVFAFLKKQEMQTQSPSQSSDVTTETPYDDITRIDATHFYIDGVHTLVGEIPMPTPCDLLESSATVAESFPEQITLDFQVINNADFCADIVTPQRFKVSAEASDEATFTALFENRVVELNLKEAAPGETPDDFEIFIKG